MKCPRCGENSYIEISDNLGGIRQCSECGYATSRLHDDEVEQICNHMPYYTDEHRAQLRWHLDAEEHRLRELSVAKLPFAPILNGRSGDKVAVQQDKLYMKYLTDSFVEFPVALGKLGYILSKCAQLPVGLYVLEGIELTCSGETVEMVTYPIPACPAPILELNSFQQAVSSVKGVPFHI